MTAPQVGLGSVYGIGAQDVNGDYLDGGKTNSATLPMEYERRISQRFGIGGLAERTWGDLDFWMYPLPFTIHAERWPQGVAGPARHRL